jgi:hypothetical protein
MPEQRGGRPYTLQVSTDMPADFLAGRGPAIWADRDSKLELAR